MVEPHAALLSRCAAALRRTLHAALAPAPGPGAGAGAGADADATGVRWLIAVALLIGSGLLFGAAVGSYSGTGGVRMLQVVYSAVKVPMLLLVAFALCVPSFFAFSTLLGLRDDFRASLAALVRVQLVLSLILASLAPYTLFWYASFAGHDAAVMFNGVLFAIASLGAQVALRRLYRPLIARHPRHRIMLWTWLGLYAFVGVQMAWVLRPFVGNPGLETKFFREDSWTNAYVWLAGAFARLLPS